MHRLRPLGGAQAMPLHQIDGLHVLDLNFMYSALSSANLPPQTGSRQTVSRRGKQARRGAGELRGTGRRWVRLTEFMCCSLSSDALGRFRRCAEQEFPPFAESLREASLAAERVFFFGGGFSSTRFV